MINACGRTDRRAALAVTSVALVGLLGGCADDGSSPGAAAVVRDTLPWGVERVVSSPALEPDWILVEEVRVGAVDGEGPESFAYIKGLAVLDDGSTAVLDSPAGEVRVFGPDGAHLATHGRAGEGPGEFQDANGLMLAPDGRLWVPDERAGRVSVFDPIDGFVESFRFETTSIGWLWSGRMGSDGRVFKPATEGESPGRRNVLRVYDQTMTEVVSMPMPGNADFSLDQPSAFCWSSSGGAMGCIGVPWYPVSVRHIDPSGAVWTTAGGSPAYRISKWTPGGDTALVAVVERSPVSVTTTERDSAEALVRDRMPEGAEFDLSRIPQVKPLVRDIFVTSEGHVWVQTRMPGFETAFDVLAADGGLMGTATWDAQLGSRVEPVVRSNSLWAVVVDELGVQYVVRARLEPA